MSIALWLQETLTAHGDWQNPRIETDSGRQPISITRLEAPDLPATAIFVPTMPCRLEDPATLF
jgi:hypothetical protein